MAAWASAQPPMGVPPRPAGPRSPGDSTSAPAPDSAQKPRPATLMSISAGASLRAEQPGPVLAFQYQRHLCGAGFWWGVTLAGSAWWNAPLQAPRYSNVGYTYTAQGYWFALHGRLAYHFGGDSARLKPFVGVELGPTVDWAIGQFELTEATPDGGLGRPAVSGANTRSTPQRLVLGLGGQAVAGFDWRLKPNLALRLQYGFGGVLADAANDVPNGYLTHSLQEWERLVHTLTVGLTFRPKPAGYTQIPRPGEQGGGRGPGGPGGPPGGGGGRPGGGGR